jgi:hypothetical protein
MDMLAGHPYLIQIQRYKGDAGTYYALQIIPVDTPSHDTVTSARPVFLSNTYTGSTDGATSDLLISICSRFDSRDVWHVYESPYPGFVSIEVKSQDMDTSLAVFDEYRGMELACNDDANMCTLDSAVCIPITPDTPYLIRVAGYNQTTGNYTLSINAITQDAPEVPHSPSPHDGARLVAPDVVLSWNHWDPPALNTKGLQKITPKGKDRTLIKAIYGFDHRLDEYQVQDVNLLNIGDATVILVERDSLEETPEGRYSLSTVTLAEDIRGLCPDEPYADEPVGGWCSGFLVAPDIVASAGHCIFCNLDINDIAFVFGFVMQDSNTAVTTLDADAVYFAKEVIALQNGNPDWSLIQLDRPVSGHMPLPLRQHGSIPDKQPVMVIGHPRGLPRKYDMGGIVRDNWMPTYFSANVDTYGGNSGSAVLNQETLVVEGILVRGGSDFIEDTENGCLRSQTYPDTGSPFWEESSRVTAFSALIPGFNVYLGTSPDQLILVSQGNATPQFKTSDLKNNQTYYWRVVSCNDILQSTGPIWTFTTQPE